MFTFLPHISRIIFALSGGFLCGVFVRSFVDAPLDVMIFVHIFVVIPIFIIFYRKSVAWLFLIFVLFSVFGVLITDRSLYTTKNIEVQRSGKVIGTARVVESVEKKSFNSHVYVQFEKEKFRTMITVEKHAHIMHGDILSISCDRSAIENFGSFDYRGYLAMKNILLACDDVEYSIIGHTSDMMSALGELRLKMERIINEIIPAPESALANGLLFGGSVRLSEELQDAFSRTGMTHIVAVSGYNVSIIIAVVMGLLIYSGFHRIYAVFGAVSAVLFFVAIIGFPSSGVRAAIMGIMVLVAAIFGRITHAYSAIVFVAAAMLFFNPLLLRYDVGFQLSFLATLGIISVYSLIESYFIRKKMALGLLEVLLLTIAAQIFVIPVIAYHFHTFSLVSLIVNLLVLPIIPFTMFFVALMIPLSFIFHPLATISGWIAYALLSYEVFVIRQFAQYDLSSVTVEWFCAPWVVVYFCVMGCVIFYLNHKRKLYEK
jgi:competence protein ComEC